MSARLITRNNTLAGLFVIGSLLLAVAIAFVLGDALDKMGSKREYAVRFPTTVGVTGLQPGAEVTFAGLPVGRVLEIIPYRPSGENGPAEAMDVIIAIDSRIALYEDALADLSPPLLGGVSRINFASAGNGAVGPDALNAELAINDANGTLDEGEIVRGRFAPSILAQLGFTAEDAARIRNAIADVEATTARAREISDRFSRMSADLEPTFADTLADARNAVADVKSFTGKFAADDGWAPRIDTILADAERTVAQGPLVAEDVREAIRQGRSLIESNQATVARILENFEQTSNRVRFETMDQAEELIERGTLALTSYRDLADNANGIVSEIRPDIANTSANARALSQQARLFLDEVRAQPWRLLKQPGKAELSREPLYAAARSYASAVADLRAASEALDQAVAGGTPADAARIARIAESVQAAYSDYDKAERALLETLNANAE